MHLGGEWKMNISFSLLFPWPPNMELSRVYELIRVIPEGGGSLYVYATLRRGMTGHDC